MVSSSSTHKCSPDMPKEGGGKRATVEKKRKWRFKHNKYSKAESTDDDYFWEEEEKFCSDSSDYAPSKKTKFTIKKFPQTKLGAVVKQSSSPDVDEQHEKLLPERLAKLKAAIDDLSDDWGMIMRTPEIATIDTLSDKIEQRDDDISQLERKLATKEHARSLLHNELLNVKETSSRTVELKNAALSKLKEENASLRLDLAQQADKVKAFEELKNFMKSTLDIEASGKK